VPSRDKSSLVRHKSKAGTERTQGTGLQSNIKLTELLGACIEGASGRLQSFVAKLPVFVLLFRGHLLKSAFL
jgi:hypothetical protein